MERHGIFGSLAKPQSLKFRRIVRVSIYIKFRRIVRVYIYKPIHICKGFLLPRSTHCTHGVAVIGRTEWG